MLKKYLPVQLLTVAIAATSLSISLPAAAQDEEHSELYQTMDVINDHYKTLGRGLRKVDADNKQPLIEATAKMKELFGKAIEMMPPKIEAMPEGEQKEQMKAYQALMQQSIETLTQISAALEANNFEEADTLFDTLKEEKAEGHEKFKSDD